MSVHELNTHDDHDHMPRWKRTLFLAAPFLCIATLVAYWLYFTLRIIFVISSQRKSGKTFPMAWVFIGTEIAVAVPLFIQTVWNVFILKRRNRPQLRLIGEDVPSVDVFVTCCQEDVDLIVDTVRAACEIDYPRERYRVVVLDDGADTELAKAITTLAQSCNYVNLHYRSRKKIPGVPHHFKAGNLNYGLEEVCHMYGGASSYMAALDADMIPERSWLRGLLPHLVNDPKMAMACPPQVTITLILFAFKHLLTLVSCSTMSPRAILWHRA
jgi:cellulose synthase/poly-beta-1,6-N-acetylglucosamine synthase-like glycosyltransferase